MRIFYLLEHLYYLGRAGEGATYASCAKRMETSKYRVTGMLYGLEMEGLVDKSVKRYKNNAVIHRFKLNACGIAVFRAYQTSVHPRYGTQL